MDINTAVVSKKKKVILDKKGISLFTLSLDTVPTSKPKEKKNYPKTVRRFCFLYFEKLRNMCMSGRQRIPKDNCVYQSLERKSPAFLSLPLLRSVIAQR